MRNEERTAPWEAEDAFPLKPEGTDNGFMRRGRFVPTTRDDLISRFSWWKLWSPKLIWAPETPRLVAPGEWPPLVEKVRHTRLIWTGILMVLALVSSFFFVYLVKRVSSPHAANMALCLVVLGLVPLAWTVLRIWKINRVPPEDKVFFAGNARFLAWCLMRKRLAVWLILAALAIAWIGQWSLGIGNSLSAAGLDPRSFALGEYWRMLTSGLLHSNFRHFIGNFLQIALLAWFIECLVGRQALLILFVAGLCGGALGSLADSSTDLSAGASGAGWALLGFLLALSLFHRQGMPRRSWVFLLWFLAVAAVCEMVLWGRVDHAGHAGGFVVGLLFGGALTMRRIVPTGLWTGRVSAGVILATALGAVAATAAGHHGIWGLSRRAYNAGNRGQHEEAVKLYSQVLSKDPANGDAFEGRAIARWNLDDLEGARADCDKWLEVLPGDPRGLILRGELRREMGDLDGALADLERALAQEPDNADALSESGRVHLLKGDLDAAMASVQKSIALTHVDFEEVLKSLPIANVAELGSRVVSNSYARFVCGQILAARGDFQGAIGEYTAALGQQSDAEYVQTARGEASLLAGHHDWALQDFESTLSKFSEDPDALFGRGRVRLAKEDWAGARADLEAALKSANRWWRRRAEAEAALKDLAGR